jgi:drug/metabolite transporter (DMT)-like permease
MKRWQAISALLLVVVIWGSTFLLVRNATQRLAVFHLLFLRFLIATLVMLPFALPALRRFTRAEWRSGVSLGVLLFVSFAAQTAGLSMTSASRGGFITGLNVVLVPVLGALFLQQRIARAAWGGVSLAVLGLLVLTRCDSGGAASWLGDLLVLLCAFTYAAHILAIDRMAKSFSAVGINTVQLGTMALLSWLFGLGLHEPMQLPSSATLLSILYLGVIASAVILALQLPAQRVVSATETALLFSLEPVFAALFAVLFGGELLCFGFWVGGALMLLGVLVCELGTPPRGPLDGEIETDGDL